MTRAGQNALGVGRASEPCVFPTMTKRRSNWTLACLSVAPTVWWVDFATTSGEAPLVLKFAVAMATMGQNAVAPFSVKGYETFGVAVLQRSASNVANGVSFRQHNKKSRLR